MNRQIIIVLLVIFTLFLASCSSTKYTKESLDKLANCLADKNVKEYGAFWCPNCAKQQKMFGSSYDIIKKRRVYVECDPRGEDPQSQLCLTKNVQKYPDWEFPDSSRLIGVQNLEYLAVKSNCDKPISK
ncbi:MAG TPA: hypothetical protein VJJ23_01765 [Candidatus Nanoarchaeia archaeon]|nr:hypothetical protein [Candidatus Nanoarchaeia archaeon]